jgi:hypothetical protein
MKVLLCKIDENMRNKTYILFVCQDNAMYSQMAEAMVKLYRDDEICAFSAGSCGCIPLNRLMIYPILTTIL